MRRIRFPIFACFYFTFSTSPIYSTESFTHSAQYPFFPQSFDLTTRRQRTWHFHILRQRFFLLGRSMLKYECGVQRLVFCDA